MMPKELRISYLEAENAALHNRLREYRILVSILREQKDKLELDLLVAEGEQIRAQEVESHWEFLDALEPD